MVYFDISNYEICSPGKIFIHEDTKAQRINVFQYSI